MSIVLWAAAYSIFTLPCLLHSIVYYALPHSQPLRLVDDFRILPVIRILQRSRYTHYEPNTLQIHSKYTPYTQIHRWPQLLSPQLHRTPSCGHFPFPFLCFSGSVELLAITEHAWKPGSILFLFSNIATLPARLLSHLAALEHRSSAAHLSQRSLVSPSPFPHHPAYSVLYIRIHLQLHMPLFVLFLDFVRLVLRCRRFAVFCSYHCHPVSCQHHLVSSHPHSVLLNLASSLHCALAVPIHSISLRPPAYYFNI